jgi:Protein of unknown function (DUF3160)
MRRHVPKPAGLFEKLMLPMLRSLFAGALFLSLALVPLAVRADDGAPLKDEFSKPEDDTAATALWPFDEPEPAVSASPSGPVAFALPAGAVIRDFEVSPRGNEVAVVTEDAAHKQSIGFWQFSGDGFSRVVEVPADTKIASLTWHPQGKQIFLMATDGAGSRILELDPASSRFEAKTVFKSDKPLRRLVVGPRPFLVGDKNQALIRLFFGEKLANGSFALRTVTEEGGRLYTVVGPHADPKKAGEDEEFPPNTTIAPSALPVEFHPAGNILIWEDERACLHKTVYDADNWGKTEPFGDHCGGIVGYTPNGAATLEWRAKTPGLHIHGLIDKTDHVVLTDAVLTSPPSQTPDGKGVVATTADGGRTTLRYLPIDVPLADVVNAWMYLEDAGDQQRFMTDRGLFRNLADNDQIYQLYDSESYTCGGQDSRIPTRPYYVTTDLFWEVYGAAFDGLFIVIEREQAMPAFKQFLSVAVEGLQKSGPAGRLAKAFAAAQAVLDHHEDGDPEAKLILAAAGPALSPVLGDEVDYAQFAPRGHYKTDDQKRYFAAMRYLTLIPLADTEVASLRRLDPAVAKAAADWIGSYQPFIAASRLDLVWDAAGAKAAIASHAGPPGTRLFPLSWAWDNEALDNVVYHSDWPAAEQIAAPDGTPRTVPSGLDFAAIAGNAAAEKLLGQDGSLAKFPNLATRIAATRQRFIGDAKRGTGTLYEKWIAALATQWADTAANAGTAGPLWDAKRLQTGLASWATLRHSTILVNDQVSAECGEGGFEDIVMRPPRGYVEPDPATFAAIADLFDATVKMVKAGSFAVGGDAQLRDGIVRRLETARNDATTYSKIADKELAGETLTTADYNAIQFVGGAVEHNFLIFMSLSNPDYALSTPDPMMKIADVASGPDGSLEVAVGRPLEWDQIVPFYGRREIVKGAVYSYYSMVARAPIDDEKWRESVDKQSRPDWIGHYLAAAKLECPAREP